MSVSLEVRNFYSLETMLDGLSLRLCLYRSENALMDASGPIPVAPLPVAPFVEADIDCFASTPTIIRLEIAKQTCMFPAAHTVVHFVLLLPSDRKSVV